MKKRAKRTKAPASEHSRSKPIAIDSSANAAASEVPPGSLLARYRRTFDPTYRCSACGCVTQLEEDWDTWERLPMAGSLPKGDCWRECPNDGPKETIVCRTDDPTDRRERFTFSHEDKSVRVCVRRVRWPTADPEDGSVQIGIRRALEHTEVAAAWAAREYMSKTDGGREPDVDLLWMYRGFRLDVALIVQDQQGNSILNHGNVERHRYWATRMFECDVLRKVDPAADYIDVFRRSAPLATPIGRRGRSATIRSRLLVPFDLRFSLAEQWAEIAKKMNTLQQSFLDFAGRNGVYPRPDSELAWRDVYCYMLTERAGMTSFAVAQKVFPNQKSGPAKVRGIVAKVRRAITEANRDHV